MQGLTDRIYEAAFVPDLWPQVLEEVSHAAGATTGAILSMTDNAAPRWRATATIADEIGDFVSSGEWRTCERPIVLAMRNYAGFLCDDDYLSPEQIARDPVRKKLTRLGLGWQLGTLVPMPTGEIVGFTFERPLDQGRAAAADIVRLDGLRPDLARAGLLTTRLRLERAETTVSTLAALGLPAAVLTATGRVLSVSRAFEAMPRIFLGRARDKVAIAPAAANALLQEAISAAPRGEGPAVRSIAISRTDAHAPQILHVLPLRRAAHDIFGGADILLIATAVAAESMVPSLSLLHGLFDLSPAEARLATALAQGKSLKAAAAESGLTFGTVRSYLEQIFRKTGTNKQSQLVALLKSAGPIAPG